MLPASWKPVAAAGLVRLGGRHDGGYVVSRKAVEASDLLLSMGLSDDWRFEEAFRKASGARILCFDHSVDHRFWLLYTFKQAIRLRLRQAGRYLAYRRFFALPEVEHRRLRIGYDGSKGVSLATLLREVDGDSIFLKVDIEGSEYRILDDIVENAARFTGIVMEFHDVDLHRDRLEWFLQSLRGFRIVDLHANNFGDVDPAGDPVVLEISLVRDDLVDATKPDSEPAPRVFPNDPTQPDIELFFESSDVSGSARGEERGRR